MFRIDDKEITQVTFVGAIRSINEQASHLTYAIEDGTGLVDVKVWLDNNDDSESQQRRSLLK